MWSSSTTSTAATPRRRSASPSTASTTRSTSPTSTPASCATRSRLYIGHGRRTGGRRTSGRRVLGARGRGHRRRRLGRGHPRLGPRERLGRPRARPGQRRGARGVRRRATDAARPAALLAGSAQADALFAVGECFNGAAGEHVGWSQGLTESRSRFGSHGLGAQPSCDDAGLLCSSTKPTAPGHAGCGTVRHGKER